MSDTENLMSDTKLDPVNPKSTDSTDSTEFKSTDSTKSESTKSNPLIPPLTKSDLIEAIKPELIREIESIQKEYNQLESNIPITHRYWGLKNQLLSLK